MCYSVAAEIDPDQPNLWYGLARAQAQLGEKEKAMESLKKAVDHANSPERHSDNGKTYINNGKTYIKGAKNKGFPLGKKSG